MRKKLNKLIVLLGLISLSFGGVDFSSTEIVPKTGTSGGHFLSVSPDAKFAGMGNAFSGYENNSASSVFYNAATLVYVDTLDVFASSVQWIADIQYTAGAIAYQRGSQSFAAHYRLLNTGNIEETTVHYPNGTGYDFAWKSMAVGVSYAKLLTNRFSFGMNIFYVSEGVAKYDLNANAVGVDVSTFYVTGFNSLKMGMNIRNFGPELDFNESFVDYADGNSVSIEPYRPYHMPLTFQVGLSYDFFEKRKNESLIVCLDGVHPNDSVERLNIGVEYTYLKLLSVRGGLYTNHDSASMMAGIGINTTGRSISLDYSISNYNLLRLIHQFSIGLAL